MFFAMQPVAGLQTQFCFLKLLSGRSHMLDCALLVAQVGTHDTEILSIFFPESLYKAARLGISFLISWCNSLNSTWEN